MSLNSRISKTSRILRKSEDINNTSESYWHISKRPIQVLLFLLPLVAYYEIALISFLQSGGDSEGHLQTQTNVAHKALLSFFDAVGIQSSGWYLPGAALIVVLLVWQVLARVSWKVSPKSLGLMIIESVVFTLPLLVFAQLESSLEVSTQTASAFMLNGEDINTLSLGGKIAIGIGAGLYEELVFRMLMLAVFHAILVDVVKMKNFTGTSIAILASAVLFMIYHWYGIEPASIPWPRSAFYLLAGVYFGILFIGRGFGIVVAVHAIYDVITVILLNS